MPDDKKNWQAPELTKVEESGKDTARRLGAIFVGDEFEVSDDVPNMVRRVGSRLKYITEDHLRGRWVICSTNSDPHMFVPAGCCRSRIKVVATPGPEHVADCPCLHCSDLRAAAGATPVHAPPGVLFPLTIEGNSFTREFFKWFDVQNDGELFRLRRTDDGSFTIEKVTNKTITVQDCKSLLDLIDALASGIYRAHTNPLADSKYKPAEFYCTGDEAAALAKLREAVKK